MDDRDYTTYWYFNTHYPEMGVHPLFNNLEYVTQGEVQLKAERQTWLIIFRATVDEINAAERLGRPMTYEQYADDMRVAEKTWSLPECGHLECANPNATPCGEVEDIQRGIVVDGQFVPTFRLYDVRKGKMIWESRTANDSGD